MSTRKPCYDAYKGTRTIANAARALLDALALVESTDCMTIHSAENCPRCNALLKEIRIEPRFVRLLCFCQECHWFLLYDRAGRIKTFAEHEPDGRPLNLPPRPTPRKPLERAIYNHLHSLRRDKKL